MNRNMIINGIDNESITMYKELLEYGFEDIVFIWGSIIDCNLLIHKNIIINKGIFHKERLIINNSV